MVVLALNRKFHTFLGVYSVDPLNSKDSFFQTFKYFVYAFGMFISLIIGSLAYLYFYFMDLATSTNSAIVLMAGCAGLGCYYTFATNIKTLRNVYDEFQDIYDKGICTINKLTKI